MQSSTVIAWQQALATQYNNLRKDVIERWAELTTTTGSANAYVLTLDAQITAYTTGMRIVFKANHTCTWASTINVNSIGAKTLKSSQWSAISNEIISWMIYEAFYDGTDFILCNKKSIFQFWDGSDGDVTISSNTTLTRDMYYNNLTVNSTFRLSTAWFRVYVKGTLTNNGFISDNGNNASGIAGWAWTTYWWAWPTGVSSSPAAWITATQHYISKGWQGWDWWAVTKWLFTLWSYINYIPKNYFDIWRLGITPISLGWTSGWGSSWPTAWGGWGGWGGFLFVMAQVVAWSTWAFEAKWWNGWNGGTAWGGWGGWGGFLFVWCLYSTYTGTTSASGGSWWTWVNAWSAWESGQVVFIIWW